MAYLATKRFNYWGQLGILTAFTGFGLVIGAIASYLPFAGKIRMQDFFSPQLMSFIVKPENAAGVKWMNSINNFFLFFFPAILYAAICHKKSFIHLGFKKEFNWLSAGVVVLIMLAALPMVSALQQLTEMLPWSKAARLKFKDAEDSYNQIVGIMTKMDNLWGYLVAVFVIGFLPALFEEALFRGGIQNLLSRWIKMPVLAIVVTSIIFSAIHGSYLGFLSRFALGFVLGWIYYRTGNIWLNILGHFFNNAFAVTALYLASKPAEKLVPSKVEEGFPLWLGLASIAAVYALLLLFEKLSKREIDRPGEEVPMPGVEYSDNPFLNEA